MIISRHHGRPVIRVFMLLDVGADFLKDFLPPGPIWFKIHEYYNRLNCFFVIAAFALVEHDLEKYGRE